MHQFENDLQNIIITRTKNTFTIMKTVIRAGSFKFSKLFNTSNIWYMIS